MAVGFFHPMQRSDRVGPFRGEDAPDTCIRCNRAPSQVRSLRISETWAACHSTSLKLPRRARPGPPRNRKGWVRARTHSGGLVQSTRLRIAT